MNRALNIFQPPSYAHTTSIIILAPIKGQFGGGPQHQYFYVAPKIEPAPVSNLGLTVQVGSNPVFVGRELNYTVQVTNAGPDPASAVRLTHLLTTGEDLVGSSIPYRQVE